MSFEPGRIVVLLLVEFVSISQVHAQPQPANTAPPRTIAGFMASLDEYKPDPNRIADIRSRYAATPPSSALYSVSREFYYLRSVAA